MKGTEGCLRLRCTSASLVLSLQEQKELDVVTNRGFYVHCKWCLIGSARSAWSGAGTTPESNRYPASNASTPNHQPRIRTERPDPQRLLAPTARGTHAGRLITLATWQSSTFALPRQSPSARPVSSVWRRTVMPACPAWHAPSATATTRTPESDLRTFWAQRRLSSRSMSSSGIE